MQEINYIQICGKTVKFWKKNRGILLILRLGFTRFCRDLIVIFTETSKVGKKAVFVDTLADFSEEQGILRACRYWFAFNEVETAEINGAKVDKILEIAKQTNTGKDKKSRITEFTNI